MRLPLYFLALVFVLFATRVQAQVVINEYSASNWKQFEDDHSDYEDWIELYNTAVSPVDLSGYALSDDEDEKDKFVFAPGTIVAPESFLLIWCSGRNTQENGFFHANFKLTQTKKNAEMVVLTSPSGSILQNIELKKTAVHQSVCRTTDGAASWQVCLEPTPGWSNENTEQYLDFADRPDMDLDAGNYPDTIFVNITSKEPNGIIRYTVNGAEPTALSPEVNGPIQIGKTTVLKARTFSLDPNILPSFIRFNTYFIQEDFSRPVFSIAADDVQELANGDKELRPIGSMEYFNTDLIREDATYGELNSHGQDSWINDQRSLDWISRDEMGYSRAVTEKVFSSSDRDAYQRLIFRAAGDDNYPATNKAYHDGSCHLRDDYVHTLAERGGMALDVRSSESCIVFLNGEYWGIYYARENPDDHDYTDYRYQQGKYDLQYLLTWDNTWAEYGGQAAHDDWRNFKNFVLNNDLSDPIIYQQVKDTLDLLSLIDYFIVNLNVVASDWLNYNTGWWRGRNANGGHQKWGYILWDLDATFDYYINYSGVPNTNYNAEPCDIEDISDYVEYDFFEQNDKDTCYTWSPMPGDTFTWCVKPDGKHQLILLKLLEENPEFRQLYYSRQADMMNTVFSCENMLSLFDEMVAILAPEMPKQVDRWGGTMIEWHENVVTMRNFISKRCDFLPKGMTNCYQELEGPYEVTLMVDPPGAGTLSWNTIHPDPLPWSGRYFGGMENQITATATGADPFHHWENTAGNIVILDPFDPATNVQLSGNDTLIAVFGMPNSLEDSQGNWSVSVMPTLVQDRFQVNIQLPQQLPIQIMLMNTLGQTVRTWNVGDVIPGKSRVDLDLSGSSHAAGLHFLHILAGDSRKTVNMVLLPGN